MVWNLTEKRTNALGAVTLNYDLDQCDLLTKTNQFFLHAEIYSNINKFLQSIFRKRKVCSIILFFQIPKSNYPKLTFE